MVLHNILFIPSVLLNLNSDKTLEKVSAFRICVYNVLVLKCSIPNFIPGKCRPPKFNLCYIDLYKINQK